MLGRSRKVSLALTFVIILKICVAFRPSFNEISPRWSLNHPRSRLQGIVHHRNALSMKSRCDIYAETTLSKPRWGGPILGPIVRFLNNSITGIIFSIFLRVFNKFKAIRMSLLLKHVFNRRKGRGLLSVSNHQSVLDDPGLWAACLPWWRIRPEQLRWSLCTEDVFFASKYVTPFLQNGNVVPLDRFGSIDQPCFRKFFELLASGSWCHIFAEGKVRQEWRFFDDEPRLADFKLGVGKLIAHCPPDSSPIVVPIYFKGMDKVVPEVVLENKKTKRPSKPAGIKTGQNITFVVGEALDFTDIVRAFRERYPGSLDDFHAASAETLTLYADIACKIRKAVLALEAEAWERKPPLESVQIPSSLPPSCGPEVSPTTS